MYRVFTYQTGDLNDKYKDFWEYNNALEFAKELQKEDGKFHKIIKIKTEDEKILGEETAKILGKLNKGYGT